MGEPRLITISRLRAFRACARYHHLSYNERWEAVDDADAANAFGTAGHRVLELWWRCVGDRRSSEDALETCIDRCEADDWIRDNLDPFRRAALAAAIAGYHARWWEASQAYEAIGVELEFRAPLRNPATGRPMKGWDEGGKMDVLVRQRDDGRVYCIEHKFSGEDVSPGSAYWRRLRVDGQVSIYLDGARTLGHEPDGCIYDVIARPAQRPYKATPLEAREYTKGKGCQLCGGKIAGVQGSGRMANGESCPGCDGSGWRKGDEPRLYKNQREADETPAEYGLRVAEAIIANPAAYYGRGDVVRFDVEAEDARVDVYESTLAIREALRTGRHPRNTDACTRLYGRGCPFLPVCSREATLDDPSMYRRRATTHPELSAAAERPREQG